jgi:chromosome segregation protein
LKISKLRLIGFKSFVEPTELAIEPGLTGVVGPNGCGKSNLLEALRWVMGESSPKSMRGQGMEDVIFSGTNARPARNSAEVLIALDNRDRRAPGAFNDSDTLEIVRRIERDAGSIYRLNGREVRQRDVQILFADASTGAHSPSLVRQGQIGELIGMKPKARRAILEEAAGISGLHSRRHEAELRLRATETNLERLSDVVQEIEAQLAGLKKQARQATRYRNISGDIRRAEAMALHLRWSAARQALDAARARLAEVAEELGRVTEEAARATLEREARADAVPPAREAEVRAAAALQRLNHERDALATEEARAKRRAEEAGAHLKQLEADLARERSLVADAEQSTEKLATEIAGLKAQIEGREAAREAARARSEDEGTLVAAAEVALDAQTGALGARDGDRARLKRVIEEHTERLSRLETELAGIMTGRAAIAPSAEEEARLAAAGETLSAALREAESLEAEASAAEAARFASEAAERNAREPLQVADRDLSILRAEAEAITRLLRIERSDLWPPLLDALKVASGYEVALGAALGDDLDAPANEAAPIHWRALPPLEAAPALPAGVRPLSEFVTAPPALARRLAQIGLVDSVAHGRALQGGLAAGQRLVTRAGDLLRWDGFAAAADAPSVAAQRLAQHNRLAELEAATAAAETKAQIAREAYHGARSAAAAAQEAELVARKRLREAQGAANAAREEAQRSERGLAQSSAQLAALEAGEKRIRDDLVESEERALTARAELAALGEDGERRAMIAAAKEELIAARAAASEARAGLQSIEREAAIAGDRLARAETELALWQARGQAARAQELAIEERIAAAREVLEAAAKLPAEIEAKRLALFDAAAKAEAMRNQAADALALAESSLKSAELALKAVEARLSQLREARARLEAQGEAAATRGEEIAHEIGEALGCAPEQALAEAGHKAAEELPDLAHTEARLERYRREREALGGVNLRADEEASEAQVRLDTLVAEKADLEGAIHKLRGAIGSLNREGRERILAAFDTVNGHFQHLFKTLFDGGSAELQLVESDDPLEAGLELVARPPGKRPTVLSLLSGGEQALTAMALIFAVFLSNPAPICVLDEVDAPLDDANVERFCNLLNEMARTTDTRFLVITHHPVTMSRMDRLYGVTMQERGISQLVSVDLTGATNLRAAG